VIHRDGGWHVAEFHFGWLALEIVVAVALASFLARGYSSAQQSPSVVKKRVFYPGAFLCGIIALALNSVGHGMIGDAASHIAIARHEAFKQNIKFVCDNETASQLHTGHVLFTIGFVLTLSGFTCMVVALARRERGWYLILTGLLIVDVMVLMLL
jgi:hypothetical protein